MDADILRLVLFLAGVGLILGIYFWDRHKRINVRVNAIHKAERERRQSAQPERSKKREVRQEPVWDTDADADGDEEPDDLSESLRELGEIVEQKIADNYVSSPLEQTAFEFSHTRSTTSKSATPREQRPAARIPQKIVQLNIMARNEAIGGDALMRAARDLQLEFGEMQIFHHYAEHAGQHEPLFSMASLVEPGTFPLDAMAEFSTPGVTLFAQLPGPLEGVETFDRMLASARRLAALLDAELLDHTRSVLSRQTIEHMREEISEHSRLAKIARNS